MYKKGIMAKVNPSARVNFCLLCVRKESYSSNVFWNHMWSSAQWRTLCTEISEVNFSAYFTDCFMKIPPHSSE